MKTFEFFKLSVPALVLMAAACSPENPRLMAPPVTYGIAETEAKPLMVSVTPKVDILMVIDNSDSMLDEQNDLSRNIDRFAKGIATNSGIDFHIGAVSVWDSITFKEMQKEYGPGELRRLKGPDGKTLPDSFGRFVSSRVDYDSYLAQQGVDLTKDPGWLQVLRASMKIGTETFNEKWREEKTGGPNVEEIFSPVRSALSAPMSTGVNKGFRRKDAHFVMIFITDSEASVRNADGTSFDLSSGELQEFLRAELGENYRDQVSALGILARSTDSPMERDPAIRYASRGPTEPVNIQSFIRDLGGRWMGLRDKNYGDAMAEFGSYVRSRTLARPRVELDMIPEWGTISVTLNGEKLELGEGWVYDDVRNSILINGDLSKMKTSGTSQALDIKVEYTPVAASSLRGGRVQVVQ
ncbi:MAG: hypothetical protein RBT63_04265 [Bdellovibrionales bacterium]|jgi:hypothetical protein|nr:hypothetical protein [Bdellovibrionales bacterium]